MAIVAIIGVSSRVIGVVMLTIAAVRWLAVASVLMTVLAVLLGAAVLVVAVLLGTVVVTMGVGSRGVVVVLGLLGELLMGGT